MVDTVREQRQLTWSVGPDATSFRVVASAGILVAAIIGGVALAGDALAWNGTSLAALWVLFGLALAWFSLRRLAGPKLHSRHGLKSGTVSSTERDGTVVYRDSRRYRRFVPSRRSTLLHLLDGRQIPARVVDLSIAGVAVETRISEKDLVAVTQVGSHPVAMVRQTPNGAVFGFDALLDPRSLDATFTL